MTQERLKPGESSRDPSRTERATAALSTAGLHTSSKLLGRTWNLGTPLPGAGSPYPSQRASAVH